MGRIPRPTSPLPPAVVAAREAASQAEGRLIAAMMAIAGADPSDWPDPLPTREDALALVAGLTEVEAHTRSGGYRCWKRGEGLEALDAVVFYGGRLIIR